jgi:hypothetical protein
LRIVDTINPTLECVDMVTVTDNAVPNIPSVATYSDNCGNVTVTHNVTVDSESGNRTLTIMVTDSSGNEY